MKLFKDCENYTSIPIPYSGVEIMEPDRSEVTVRAGEILGGVDGVGEAHVVEVEHVFHTEIVLHCLLCSCGVLLKTFQHKLSLLE